MKLLPINILGLLIPLACSQEDAIEANETDSTTETSNVMDTVTSSDDNVSSDDSASSDDSESEPVADSGTGDFVEECVHPEVVESCEGEWCSIAPGCFLYGSFPSEPCRSAYSEEQVYVTLTHPFVIGRTELTQKQWELLGFENPSPLPHCEDCPVAQINWFEALAFCNALSIEEGFEPCYNLSTCQGEIGTGCLDEPDCFIVDPFFCTGEVNRFVDVYQCPGYRLPTTAEWEYAARAGTTTETYIGDSNADEIEDCAPDPVTDQVAWSCSNTDVAMPSALKLKNGWGLYDMLGNVMEWAADPYLNTAYGGGEAHRTDPYGFTDNVTNDRPIRGGMFHLDPSCSRSASNIGYTDTSISSAVGFRPVRTLFEE